jgi:hypothetical protein
MAEHLLPVDAASGDARHRDVRTQVFAAVPQRRASIAKRAFWRIILFVAKFPVALKLVKRIRGS